MRGWLASGFLAVAVIGGYLGLLPLLSSLASGPAWPQPIATRDASGVVTVAGPADETADPAVIAPSDAGESEVVSNEPTADEKGSGKDREVVSVVVGGDIDRVEQPKKKKKTPPASGGSSSGSPSASPSDSSGGGSSGGGSNVVPSGGGSDAPAAPTTDPWSDFDGAGEFAGTEIGDAGDDDTIISGP